MYQIAESSDQAAYQLRCWAARILRNGHQLLDLRSVAGKILATSQINMVRICENKLAHEIVCSDGMELK